MIADGRQWALFLRGLNVGGSARVSMDKLRSCVEKAGFAHAKHYLQSGNIVFSASKEMEAEQAAETVVSALDEIGLQPECILRSKDELQSILTRNRLSDFASDDSKYLVHLFNKELTQEEQETILKPFDDDTEAKATFSGRELFVWCPNGVSKSPWFKIKFEKLVPGNAGTSRNWRTLTKVLDLMHE